jgi:hypothetical protein
VAGLVPEQPKKTMMKIKVNDNAFFIVIYSPFLSCFSAHGLFSKPYSNKELDSMGILHSYSILHIA